MKKNLILIVFVLAAFAVAVIPVLGNSAEDYKVIQNAVSTKKTSGEVSFLRIEVKDLKNNKENVKIKIPLSLVDLCTSMIPEAVGEKMSEKMNEKTGKKCDIDFKKMMNELKKAGPGSLVEIETGDETVKIWLE